MMQLLLILFLSFFNSSLIHPSAQTNISTTQAFDYEANTVFHAISFPLSTIKDPFTSDILTKIDKTFGTNFEPEQVELIKKAYVYLIFLTKLEKVQTNPQFSVYKSDFAAFLQDNNKPLPHIPDEALVTSTGWNAVQISSQDIINSTPWQLFCKAMVSGSYHYFFSALDIIHNIEGQTFNYIPHIETSFYNKDYTQLRTVNEITRIKIILEQTLKEYFLNQCADWKHLPNISPEQSGKTKSLTLEHGIVAFRQTSFYKVTHDIYELLGLKNDGTTQITHQDLLTPRQLTSPLKEYAWCFFMLKEVLMLLYGSINETFAQYILYACESSGLNPNIFPYTLEDLVYFDELIAVKSKSEETHKQSIHPSPDEYKVEETHLPLALAREQHLATGKTPQKKAEVAAQNIFTDLWHDIKKGSEEIWHGIKSAADAAVHAVKAAAEGVAGIGATILGNVLDIKYLKEHGSELEKDAVHNLKQTTKDLESSVNDFAKGIEDGIIAPTAEITGDLAAVVTDDKKLGESLQNVINSVSDSLVNIGAKMEDMLIQTEQDATTTAFQVGLQFANVVASASITTLLTNPDEFLKNVEGLLSTTIHSITQSFSGLLHMAKQAMTAVMQGLNAIINSMTTLFIDISRDISFIAAASTGVGLIAWEIAYHSDSHMRAALQKYRNHTTNVLNAHRQTINQVMGVAAAIGFSIATAGTGSGAAAGMVAAEAGAEATAEVAAETATETAAEDAAESAAETAAESGAEDAAESATEDAGKETLKEVDLDAEGSIDSTIRNVAFKGLELMGMAMNVVFGAFSVMSGANSDAKNIRQEKEEAKTLSNLWSFTNNSKLSAAQTEYNFFEELQAKQQAEIGNRMLSLSFFQNVLYGNVDTLSQTLAKVLAQKYISLLSPDAHNMLPANIGTSWGIASNYLDLYPSEGFSTVTTGRPNFPFAQEVAQAPFAAQKGQAAAKDSLFSHKKKEPSKLWFNQKVVALDAKNINGSNKQPKDPLKVDIEFQFIYTLDSSFYTGLYLGGKYYDYTSQDYLTNLKKDEKADLDSAHLAKMVVLYRESGSDPVHVGVYEHEGKGWIIQEKLPSNMQLDQHHTYHINTILQDNGLSIAVWIDNDIKNSWKKAVNVTSIENQRTYGVISSGAAIQWNQLSPQPIIKVNSSARPPLQKLSEIEREKQIKQRVSKLMQTTFGSMNLQSLSKQAVLFGQYLYTTKDTGLAKINPKTPTDYVLFATHDKGETSNIGAAAIPLDNTTEKPNAIISIITGNVYNTEGHTIAHLNNIWNIYDKLKGPFNKNINEYITTMQKAVSAQLSKIKFGSFKLDIISSKALESGHYIYKCNQTLDLKDSTGKSVSDYLIMAEIANNKLGSKFGIPPTSSNAQGLLSLVTGNLYTKNTDIITGKLPKPISKGYSELFAYENQFGEISPQGLKEIELAQNLYQADKTKEKAAKKTIPVITFPSGNATSSSLALSSPASKTDQSILLLGSPPQGKISQLQKQAAGSVGLQLIPPKQQGIQLGGFGKKSPNNRPKTGIAL